MNSNNKWVGFENNDPMPKEVEKRLMPGDNKPGDCVWYPLDLTFPSVLAYPGKEIQPTCELKPKSFMLRGLCDNPDIKADVYYTLINSTTFLGHIYSKIIYRDKMWDLVSTIDNSVIAFTTLENAHELPIGLHVWTFFPFTDNNCNNYPKLG